MDYAVKRLNPETGHPPSYHLVDSDGELLIVANQRTAAGAGESDQLRLTRPDGKLLATIDLPELLTGGEQITTAGDYAVVHDYAVYAILNVHRRQDADNNDLYFMLEVEGEKWLMLPQPEQEECYAFYDQIPAGLRTYGTLTEGDLPASIGYICKGGDQFAYRSELQPGRLQQTGLVVLTLAFLLERVADIMDDA